MVQGTNSIDWKNGQQLNCVLRPIDNSTIIMISHFNRFESLLIKISREPSFFLCPMYVEFNNIRCLFLITGTQYNMILQIWNSSKSEIPLPCYLYYRYFYDIILKSQK